MSYLKKQNTEKNNITHNRIKFHHHDDANDSVVVVVVVFELL